MWGECLEYKKKKKKKKALPFVILNMTFPALCMQFLKYKLHSQPLPRQLSSFLFSAFSSIFCLFCVFLLLNIQYSFVKYICKPAVNTGHRLFDKIKLNEIKGAQSSGNTLLQNGCCWIYKKTKTKNKTKKSLGIP